MFSYFLLYLTTILNFYLTPNFKLTVYARPCNIVEQPVKTGKTMLLQETNAYVNSFLH